VILGKVLYIYVMPRPKTIQPNPLTTFNLEAQIFEVRDKNTWEIGRGQDKNFLFRETNSHILNGLLDDLQSGNRKREEQAREALSSKSAMDRFINKAGYEMDERTGRRHGKFVIGEFQLLMKLVRKIEVLK